MASTMKAWQWTTINGTLEQSLTLNLDAPAPDGSKLASNQILVEVLSAALNPVDYKLPESGWIASVMIRGRPATPGLDFCGRVVAKHHTNTSFTEGQLVFGGLGRSSRVGTLCQYIIITTDECAGLPEGISPDQAAAFGCAATTALQSVPSQILKPGSKVLINGGSGGVGTFAIQFAKALGAEIVTTCSTANVELCRRLGAGQVMDYKSTDVIETLKQDGRVFNLVVDNVGDQNLYSQSSAILKKGGTFMQVGVAGVNGRDILSTMGRAMWPGDTTYHFVNMKSTSALFTQISTWLKEGKVRPVIDEVFDLEDVPKAYAKLRTGRAKGKIIVQVAKQTRTG